MDDQNSPQPSQMPQMEQPPVTPTPHFAETPPPSVQAPKPKRKGWLITLIVVGIVALLGAGSALAYNFWYQNPEKVISDGVANAITAKSVVYTGSYTIEGDSMNLRVEIVGKNTLGANDLSAKVTAKIGGEDITIAGDVIVDTNGDLYVRLNDIDVLVKEKRDALPEGEERALVDQLVAKINNQWVKISIDDMKAFQEGIGKAQQCVVDTFKKARDDNGVMNEVADVYKKHKFIIIEETLGAQNGSLGYRLRHDGAVQKDFTQALKETAFYKTLHECDEAIELDGDVSPTEESMRIELWVERWTHQITKVTSEVDQDGSTTKMVIEPRFNEDITIAAPEASVTLQQLQADIMQLLQQMQAARMVEQEPATDLFSSQL